MALTNSQHGKAAEHVVTDVNAPVEVSVSPRTISPEAAILFNKGIVARPLASPEVCSIRVKNTEYRYRWVNRMAKGGQLYMQRKAQGFINATSDDVEILSGDVTNDKGDITAFDLVLMKIQADRYDAAIKFNMEKAVTQTRARGMYLDGGSTDVNSDAVARRVSVTQEAYAKTGKATAFIPDNPDALVDDSIRSHRVDKTREVVDNLREQKK